GPARRRRLGRAADRDGRSGRCGGRARPLPQTSRGRRRAAGGERPRRDRPRQPAPRVASRGGRRGHGSMTDVATPITRLEATVRGRVQGVGFRYWVVRRATEMGLTGWVANELDGSVRCVAEGPPPVLDRLEATLRAGPTGAAVAAVHVARPPAAGT